MRENFGNGWVARGPRIAVPMWDEEMGKSKGNKPIDSRLFGYSEIPIGLIEELEEAKHGDAAPHIVHHEWDEQ